MLFKLAMRNIRKSVKDYAIYFVTLLLAVTIFYAFNSISDQQVLANISKMSNTDWKGFIAMMIGIFSYVIAFVLGFLIVYANSLLIRRRKREFGTYLLLGMRPGQVSRIIVYETALVGIVSLALGLALGIMVSQLLSFATAALFGIALPNYQFEFSLSAFLMTLACFCVIFIVVAVFNVFSIRRCKLINLMNADVRNQKVVIRNPWVCLVLFVVSLVLLGIAYWRLQINGMTFVEDPDFVAATALMLIGTFLLFFSLAGFIIGLLTHVRPFYLQKLRPFTTRQVASKVNTSFVSIWIVCILLFFAVTTFATGMGMVAAFVGDIDAHNPYDVSAVVYPSTYDEQEYEGTSFGDVRGYFEKHVYGWKDNVAESAQISLYALPNITYGDVIKATGASVDASSMLASAVSNQSIFVVSLSDFNQLLALQHKPAVSLEPGTYLITNNIAVAKDVVHAMVDQKYLLHTKQGKLLPEPDIIDIQLFDNPLAVNAATIVVPDEVVQGLNKKQCLNSVIVNITCTDKSDAQSELVNEITASGIPGAAQVVSRDSMSQQYSGIRLSVTYLALYIGLSLLLAVAAVLAIQLLTLANDSLGSYRTLSRLGCDTRMINRSLFAQTLLYFLAPLVVAVCHSAWVIHLMTVSIFKVLGADLLPTILMSAGLVLLIYGGYMLITYFVSRSMVRQGIRQRT